MGGVCYNFGMALEIKPIRLPLPFHLGTLNSYLLKGEGGFMLIDTGCSNSRDALERRLLAEGCAGRLKLIVLTHGDFDHSGNAAYLRKRFGAVIAMHRGDTGMVEEGNIFAGRRKMGNALFRRLAPFLFGFGKPRRFKPDFYLEEGDELAEYGFEAKIVHIPGHSSGSIGVVTEGGGLFCGDLMVMKARPVPNRVIDDPAVAEASIKRLRELGVHTVYPGHGRAFPMEKMGEKDK